MSDQAQVNFRRSSAIPAYKMGEVFSKHGIGRSNLDYSQMNL